MTRPTLGVIGAGTMGAGIAQKLAMEGFRVGLCEVDEESAARGLARIVASLEEAVAKKVLDKARADAALGRVTATADLGVLAKAQLVIEAVFERFDIKHQLLRTLEGVVGPRALLATNTSSLRVSDLQVGLAHPERLVGLHFFFHPAKNRLVEVVGGAAWDEGVLERAWRWMEAIGKTPIESSDSAGFVVNRYFVPWLCEAVRLAEEGVARPAVVDRIAQQVFGSALGPFELMNLTGVPIALHAATSLGEAFGPFYAPPRLLEAEVVEGDLWEIGSADSEPDPEPAAEVASRLRGAVWLAAGQLVEEGVATPEDCEIGARVGLQWSQGPFELWNRLGPSRSLADVERMAERWGVHLPKPFLTQAPGSAPAFALRTVKTKIEGDVALVTLARPAELNALSPGLVSDLGAAMDALEADPRVHGIVLLGLGKAFAAGADLKFFAEAFDRQDFDAAVSFGRQAAALWNRIDRYPGRVVALCDGLALGGGAELLMAADLVVATDRACFGYPETGLGIYPGLGGTQRTTRRVGRPLTRWLCFVGRTLDAETAHGLGLFDRLAPRREALDLALALARGEDPGPGRGADHALRAMAERLCGDAVYPRWLEPGADPGADSEAGELVRAIAKKGPLALKTAAELIAMAADPAGDLSAGLAAEAERMAFIFRTEDAVEGIRALVQRRKPVFKGK
jgi:enoyl-CoA hydratase/3-hydroxyacyl-CoA dehydrogenase